MDEDKREARRRALAEQVAALKRGETVATAPADEDEEEDEGDDELDWDVEPGSSAGSEGDEASTGRTSTLDASAPNIASLDSGWDEDDEDEEDEEEEEEPELPDERFDPIAYAEAKKALEERREARRQKKREKDAAKKARRKARALALKERQKGKSKKTRPSKPAPIVQKKKKKRPAPEAAISVAIAEEGSVAEKEDRAAPTRRLPKKQSRTNMMVLTAVLLVFAAAVAYALLHK
ncbi:MAG: hypothetical protein ABI551_22715 [Polyangiaceae bacterium]